MQDLVKEHRRSADSGAARPLGEFEPVVIKNNQTNVTGIEDQIIALYAKGVSARDITRKRIFRNASTAYRSAKAT